MVPYPTSRVHFKPRGPCSKPQRSPSSQDCQTTAGRTASLTILGEKSSELMNKHSWRWLPRKPAAEAFCGPGTWSSESPRASSVPCPSNSLHFVLGRKYWVTSHGFWDPFFIGKRGLSLGGVLATTRWYLYIVCCRSTDSKLVGCEGWTCVPGRTSAHSLEGGG